jgi:hypothetical protein
MLEVGSFEARDSCCCCDECGWRSACGQSKLAFQRVCGSAGGGAVHCSLFQRVVASPARSSARAHCLANVPGKHLAVAVYFGGNGNLAFIRARYHLLGQRPRTSLGRNLHPGVHTARFSRAALSRIRAGHRAILTRVPVSPSWHSCRERHPVRCRYADIELRRLLEQSRQPPAHPVGQLLRLQWLRSRRS